jgi:hypothetical protein
MPVTDELDFERMVNLADGFGWKVKARNIHALTLELVLEKDRIEPDLDQVKVPS